MSKPGTLKRRWRKLRRQAEDLLIRVLEPLRLPGYREVPVYPVLKMLASDIGNRAFVLNSSAMAYAFFLSIFPSLIFAFSLLPYLPIQGLEAEADEMLMRVLPPQAYDLLHDTLLYTVREANLGRLFVALFFVLFMGIRGVVAMANAFNTLDPLHQRDRNLIQNTLLGVYIYMALLLMGTGSIWLWVEGDKILASVKDEPGWWGQLQYWGVLIALRVALVFMLMLALNFIYKTAPTYRYSWRSFSPGSLVAALLLLLAFALLKVYFTQFTNYNKVYGSLGAAIVLLVWFYWLSFVLQIGFHLNSNIHELLEDHRRLLYMRGISARKPDEDATDMDYGNWMPGGNTRDN